MHEKNISKDRQKYLKQIKVKKFPGAIYKARNLLYNAVCCVRIFYVKRTERS